MFSSLFKRFTNSPVAGPPADIDKDGASKPRTDVPVIAVRDQDGFAYVQYRPLTYAEVASMREQEDSDTGRVAIPPEAMYPDSEEEEETVQSVTTRDHAPRYGIQVASEFEYGDRVRSLKLMKQSTMTKPHAYMFKLSSDKLVKNHVVKLSG